MGQKRSGETEKPARSRPEFTVRGDLKKAAQTLRDKQGKR